MHSDYDEENRSKSFTDDRIVVACYKIDTCWRISAEKRSFVDNGGRH